jgi:predicted kinase
VRIAIPEPALVVFVGAAGAGKSTLAARLFGAGEVLSSDAFRAVVGEDEADQRVTRVAYSILHRELGKRLAARRTTVVDATNVTAYARRGLVRRASSAGMPAVAIVLHLPPTLVLARNATRPGRWRSCSTCRRRSSSRGTPRDRAGSSRRPPSGGSSTISSGRSGAGWTARASPRSTSFVARPTSTRW